MSVFHVCFSHGKESGPYGSKITELLKTAESRGHETASLDYRGMENPEDRVEKLILHLSEVTLPLVLVGSSMGGYVAAAAACDFKVEGLFLLAPALFLPGYPGRPMAPQTESISIVHGWRDTVIPLENSIRFAGEHLADLHVINGDHRLNEKIEDIKYYFNLFLQSIENK